MKVGAVFKFVMRKVSNKQSLMNRAVAKIKASKSDRCVICGRPYVDAAHILPKSMYPEYYTAEWNIVPLCREHHTRFDNCRAFRQQCTELYEIARSHDECAANRYFGL